MFTPTRRTFLQTALAAASSLFLPRFLLTGGNSFWFLHLPSGDSWSVTNPVSWALENSQQPMLERARERLVTLDASDPQRVIRLVTRRCKLNLIEIHPERIVVHHWGTQGQGDLRPFFKQHGLATKGVTVALIDRKRETTTLQHGDDFLYGQPLSPFWPWKAYQTKWQRRGVQEPDDWTAAPHTWSGFAWKGIEPNRIPWAALKSAWQRTTAPLCLNCDQPTLLSNFGLPQYGMFNREALFLRDCRQCQRQFQDYSIDRYDVGKWMVSHLDAEVLPDFILWMGKPVKWEPPSSDGASEGHLRSTSDTKTA
jgi:hypothetical protein